MMKNKLNKQGMSLVEVILAGLLFSLSVAGFYAALRTSNDKLENSRRSVEAARYAQEIASRLSSNIGADTWNNPEYSVGVLHTAIGVDNLISQPDAKGITYDVDYTVTCVPVDCSATNAVKQFQMTVNYNEL